MCGNQRGHGRKQAEAYKAAIHSQSPAHDEAVMKVTRQSEHVLQPYFCCSTLIKKALSVKKGEITLGLPLLFAIYDSDITSE
jgi:hypothetical protein